MVAAAGQGPVPALARGSRRPGRASLVRWMGVRSAVQKEATPEPGELFSRRGTQKTRDWFSERFFNCS